MFSAISFRKFNQQRKGFDTSKAELLLRDISNILDTLDIEHFLGFGTLLGVYRDGQLIEYDTDVDLCTVDLKAPEVVQDAILKGLFNAKGILAFKGRSFTFERDGVSLDLYLFKEANAQGIHNCSKFEISAEQWPLGNIEFQGKIYKAPKQIERYLQVRYGSDWKTPKRGHHAKR